MKAIALPAVALVLACGAPVLHADSPLEESMDQIDSAYKRIKRVEDPAEGVKEARAGQKACLESLTLVPAMVGKMPEGKERDKEVAEYKRQMALLYVTFCKAEISFLEGKMEAVDELVDAFKAHKKEGHERFIEDE